MLKKLLTLGVHAPGGYGTSFVSLSVCLFVRSAKSRKSRYETCNEGH